MSPGCGPPGRNHGSLSLDKARQPIEPELFYVYAYDYNGPMTFDYIPGRQVLAYLAIDI